MTAAALDSALADRFAAIALGHVTREYPHKLDHVLTGDADALPPRVLHPLFFGSFDWHSCVHGYWLLAFLLRRFPEGGPAPAIAAMLDTMLTEQNVAGELAYLQRPASRGFERPYGWAWLLMLQAELDRHPQAPHRADALRPLALAFAERFRDFLPTLTYPLRAGSHANSAFAVILALAYAHCTGDAALAALLCDSARRWYLADAGDPAPEPGGDDFLSPALIEAECLRRVLPPARFAAWFAAFLPRLSEAEPGWLFRPVTVSDRSDGKTAHLDGLNFSRAWCLRGLASALPPGHAARPLLLDSAERHIQAALPHVAGDYMGEHWLASFATLALTAGNTAGARQ